MSSFELYTLFGNRTVKGRKEMRTQAQLDLAWEVLTNCAKAKETITYRSLAARLGANVSARSVGRQYLDDISEHCESNDAPGSIGDCGENRNECPQASSVTAT